MHRDLEGQNVQFRLNEEIAADEKGLQRYAYTLDSNKTVLGIVEDATHNELVLHVFRGNPDRLPQRGQLLIDDAPSRISIRRQKHALDDIQYERALRPDLKHLLLHPENVALPVSEPLPPLFQENLDAPKQKALQIALNSSDIVAVQGPPGTGKTTWIAELVCQFLRQKKGRVLLSGQTHIAVDNALEKIQRLSGKNTKSVRVGPINKVSGEVEQFHIDGQMTNWEQEIRERSDGWLRKWATDNGVSKDQLALGGYIEVLENAYRKEQTIQDSLELKLKKESEILQEHKLINRLADSVFEQAAALELILNSLPDLKKTQQLQNAAALYVERGVELAQGLQDEERITSLLEELRQQIVDLQETADGVQNETGATKEELANLLEDSRLQNASLEEIKAIVGPLISTASQQTKMLTHLQMIQSDWLQRFGTGDGFRSALLLTADVVAGTCIGVAGQNLDDSEFDLVIIDEASKATPTEALTAMVRGKRWVLVGDQKQLPPFFDESIKKSGLLEKYNEDDLRQTLFDRLVSGLPHECVPTLSTQHRMQPSIGRLISEVFYNGELASERTDPPHIAISKQLSHQVTWFSTSALSNRREGAGVGVDNGENSYINKEEAERILKWLEQLNLTAHNSGSEPLKVGVISGYNAQKGHLYRVIVPNNKNKWQKLEIDIKSVDEFQGREVDILVYSVTRSNSSGILGFVREPHRLNVALSRGRDALVIFGDAEHCLQCSQKDNAFPDVINHILTNSQECRLEVLR